MGENVSPCLVGLLLGDKVTHSRKITTAMSPSNSPSEENGPDEINGVKGLDLGAISPSTLSCNSTGSRRATADRICLGW